VTVQTDGNFLISGGSNVTRTTPNGSLDTTFGASGIVTPPKAHELKAMALQNDGKIVAVGNANYVENVHPADTSIIVRLNP
jgi:hypothetical protein